MLLLVDKQSAVKDICLRPHDDNSKTNRAASACLNVYFEQVKMYFQTLSESLMIMKNRCIPRITIEMQPPAHHQRQHKSVELCKKHILVSSIKMGNQILSQDWLPSKIYFQHNSPKMYREYITRLVMDH
jgi:hypothetical protein